MTTHQTQLRLWVYGSSQVSVRSLLEELSRSCRVVMQAINFGNQVNFAARATERVTPSKRTPGSALEVELSGPISAIQCLLAQLENYPVTIQGKGQPAGDAWHY